MTQFRIFLAALSSMYSPNYPRSLVWLLEKNKYRLSRYFASYWSTQSFVQMLEKMPRRSTLNRGLAATVYIGSLLQVVLGLSLLIASLSENMFELTLFGFALIVSYPLVWAHLIVSGIVLNRIIGTVQRPKSAGKNLVCLVLEWQVKRLRRRHSFTLIAVAGSVGKTSTKLAIAHTLEPTRRVIYQTGNYNDRVTVPLVLFGRKMPNLLNIVAWVRIFVANERTISQPKFYDMAVLEIGTDHPGDMARFAYLAPDITVMTAITPEHMEYFKTLDAVATEELSVFDYSKQVIVNVDDTPSKYLASKNYLSYSSLPDSKADFRAVHFRRRSLDDARATFSLQHAIRLEAAVPILGAPGVKIVLAAAATAQLAGLSASEITKGLKEIRPFAGRMQILAGKRSSMLIDDTYNATPIAATSALDVLYAADTEQRIAVLGSMNELGSFSREAHAQVGAYCDASKLALVVTIGRDARSYLAPAAEAAGCTVECFDSPYAAGAYVAERLEDGAVVLAKGSQNGVFAEESLKPLLAKASDSSKLVRQSAEWLAIKRRQFSDAK